jgi:glutamate-1-semialdehyde aminotransferase
MLGAHDARYLDFVCGLGAVSLSYSNQKVIEAVTRQAQKGSSFSLPHTLEIETAEHIRGLVPGAERIRFLKNGDDASRAAVRIARAYTNRTRVLSDGYHGHSDLFTSLTEPALGVKDKHEIYPLEEDNIDSAVACVIVEALKLSDKPQYMQWLKKIREKCREVGAVFVMDEIVTNCRVSNLTVSKWWDIDPDLILLGKGIANGWPIAVIGGKKDLMNCGEYFISTTFGGCAVDLAACNATLTEIEKRSLVDLVFYGKRLVDRLNALHPEIKWEGWGTRAQLNVENPTTQLFLQEAVRAGIFFGKAFFFNFAMLEANLEEFVLNTCRAIVERIKRGEVRMEGLPPHMSFKR